MNEDLYFELSAVLALNTYARCVMDHDGYLVHEHFNGNRLGIPPDILSRLGVMHPLGTDAWRMSGRHFFPQGWSPKQPLALKRHDGEPSIFDLIVAVCMLVDWDRQFVSEGIGSLEVPPTSEFPELDMSNSTRFNSEPQLTFRDLVFCKAARQLERLGLGQWKDGGHFELIFPLLGDSPIDLADSYRETRHLMAQRLGGVRFLFPPDHG